MTVKLEIGKRYPKKYDEGAALEYVKTDAEAMGHFELKIVLRGISSEEVKAFETGEHVLGLFQYEGVLMFLSSFKGLLDSADAPFHFGLYSNSEEMVREFPRRFAEGDGFLLQVHVVDSSNGLLKALKLIKLGSDFSSVLATMCHFQSEMPVNKLSLLQTISYVQQIYSVEDMFREAIIVNRGNAPAVSKTNGDEPLKVRASLAHLAAWGVKKKTYHSPIPKDLEEYHYWIADSGHIVMAVPTVFMDKAKDGKHFDYEVPVPIKYTLTKGYINHGDFIEIDAPYDKVFGLTVDEEYEEF